MREVTKTRGGFREGAGRKPTGRRKVNFYITEQEETFLKQQLNQLRSGSNMIIKAKNFHDGNPCYTELENGIWLKNMRDGRGFDDDGNEWEEIQEEISEDEWKVLGWRKK